MDRINEIALVLVFLVAAPARPAGAAVAPILEAAVDRDDDDGDGVADAVQTRNVPVTDLALIAGADPKRKLRSVSPAGAVRVLVDGVPIATGTALPTQSVQVQALKPGRHIVDFTSSRVQVRALQVFALDGENRTVDFTASHASFQRTPPNRLDSVTQRSGDTDALRFVVVGHAEDVPDHVRILSRAERGGRVDELSRVKVVDVACPPGVDAGLVCRSTWPIRVVADDVDRTHPLVKDRSIRAEIGGGLTIYAGAVAQQIRVGGPRRTKEGPIRRLRANLRLTILRTWQNGAPSLEGRDDLALSRARDQLAGATSLWQQCGISFGDPSKAQVRIVDPPPPHLVAVGCDLGLPASGGRVRLSVEGHDVSVDLAPGMTPLQAARKISRALTAAEGELRIMRSSNARIGPGTFPVVDLVVNRGDRPARVAAPKNGIISSDPTMPVCIGHVDLAKGLDHFLDVDSMAGTVEERALLKWIDDRDPGTLDGVFIPAFMGGGRIGESFIGNDRSSLRNLVLVDRAGVAASQASHTLAHEMGHVLLDVPGHPDDYGVDQPTLLMDSDAANPSAFGPRRLSVEECERAIRQSGAKAPVVILEPWPFEPLPK